MIEYRMKKFLQKYGTVKSVFSKTFSSKNHSFKDNFKVKFGFKILFHEKNCKPLNLGSEKGVIALRLPRQI